MNEQSVISKIKLEFEFMPDQMKSAAEVVIDNPTEVALLSMRDLAKKAGIAPATMTRLAKRIGYTGYEELKAAFVSDFRSEPSYFTGRAKGMLKRRQQVGEKALASDVATSIANSVLELSEARVLDRFKLATDIIINSRRVYCSGARSSFPVAFLFSYLQGYLWDRACLLDGPGGAGMDPILHGGELDVLLAVSFEPYSKTTFDLVSLAKEKSIKIIAITDQELRGIGRNADVTIIVPNKSPSFFDSMTPAFASVEVLASMIAGRLGPDAATKVREREALIEDAGVWQRY